MVTPKPRVYIVDDDEQVLVATSRLLRANGMITETFSAAAPLLKRCSPAWHGCIILDYLMPEMDGLMTQDELARLGCDLPVIFLTGRGDIPISVHAMKHGAQDFITKPLDGELLLTAVMAAITRDAQRYRQRLETSQVKSRLSRLTPREYEVLCYVAAGSPNKVTAAELGTVEKTVKVHRARVFEKMGVESAAELARIAERVHLDLPIASSTAK